MLLACLAQYYIFICLFSLLCITVIMQPFSLHAFLARYTLYYCLPTYVYYHCCHTLFGAFVGGRMYAHTVSMTKGLRNPGIYLDKRNGEFTATNILQRHEEYSATQEQDRLLEERQRTTRRFCCSFQLRDKTPEACVSSTAAGERGGFCCSSDTGESQTWGRERGIFRVSISKFVRFNICA